MSAEFDPEVDIDVTGLEPWRVLQALYNASRSPGCGAEVLGPQLSRWVETQVLSDADARKAVADQAECESAFGKQLRFDYVFGRPIKIVFETSPDGSRVWLRNVALYNRDSLTPAHVVIHRLINARFRAVIEEQVLIVMGMRAPSDTQYEIVVDYILRLLDDQMTRLEREFEAELVTLLDAASVSVAVLEDVERMLQWPAAAGVRALKPELEGAARRSVVNLKREIDRVHGEEGNRDDRK